MEKKTETRKVATAWDEESFDVWYVKTLRGWDARYTEEEKAIKAEEFLAELNWTATPILEKEFENINLSIVECYFKYPLKEITGGWHGLLPIELSIADKERVGHQRILLGDYSYMDNGYDENGQDYTFLDDWKSTELINKLKDEKASV